MSSGSPNLLLSSYQKGTADFRYYTVFSEFIKDSCSRMFDHNGIASSWDEQLIQQIFLSSIFYICRDARRRHSHKLYILYIILYVYIFTYCYILTAIYSHSFFALKPDHFQQKFEKTYIEKSCSRHIKDHGLLQLTYQIFNCFRMHSVFSEHTRNLSYTILFCLKFEIDGEALIFFFIWTT